MMTLGFWARRRTRWAVAGALAALCAALPTRNSTADAWAYAAQVRYGHELLLPHHLWHSAAGWAWVRGLGALGRPPDALAALKLLNALAAGALLAALGGLLRRVGGRAAPIAAWLLAVGSSFGLLRFATENETYVLPLLASVLASAAWARALGAPAGRGRMRLLLLAGTWAAVGALLHQVHFWWWLGLLAGSWWGPPTGPAAAAAAPVPGEAPWRRALWFGLPAALLWPLAYAAALPAWGLPLTPGALWHFGLHDYYSGTAAHGTLAHGLLLTGIGLVRTLVQVHGYLGPLLRRWPALGLVAVGCVALGGYALAAVRRARKLEPLGPAPAAAGRRVAAVHALIFSLQLAFAAVSDGNAEFMVMLPALAAVVAVGAAGARLPGRAVAAGGGALLAWNLAFGLLPLHFLVFQNTAPLLACLRTRPRARLLLADPNLLLNQWYYQTGRPAPPPQVLPAPARLVQRLGGLGPARAWLGAQGRAGHPVYTDLVGNDRPLNRARLLSGAADAALVTGFSAGKVDSAATFFGPYYLCELR
ncbi:hypothetical protein ACFQ48_02820 [Hymenobacter caeli]|uniref:Glycosyltransferase RgtA/B/C/D-like domain-containing protein n=1 Tax=Hymenobacter caeli TaxID=2735894 RepID=A0ABX2FL70_9BACT|nr:hypothetical protein [Hymenobacter caeli]NRT17756.1 hypothetical protein [Hymenobacter caeli]